MWLYYITDRKQLAGAPAEQRRRLLDKIAEAARCGVHFIQLREKDLSSRELESLARDVVAIVRETQASTAGSASHSLRTKLLINSRADVALATGADGVHLPASDLTAAEARNLWNKAASSRPPVIGVSCHTADDVRRAHTEGADFAVFAPVFEKVIGPERHGGTGLVALRQACEAVSPAAGKRFPVFALGGVTLENAQACIEAGAAGVAGIRLFQDHDVHTVVVRLAGRNG